MKRSSAVRVGVAGAACALLAQGAAFGAAVAPLELTKPVQATGGNVDPGRLYSSPAIAVDPKDPMRVVAGVADLRNRRCSLLRSFDGAKTWSIADASPALAAFPFCSQSQGGVIQAPVAFGRNGTLYMAMGGWDDQDGARASGGIVLARSTNLGDTWQTVNVYNGRGKTGEAAENPRPPQGLTVDTTTGNDDTVYVSFNLSKPGLVAPNAVPAVPMVAVSKDGGRTFGAPTDLSAKVFEPAALRDQALTARTTTTVAANATTTTTTIPPAGSKAADPGQVANFGGSGARLGVDAKGVAYALWQSATSNVTPSPPAARFLSTSADGGRTWTTTQTMPFSYDNGAPRFAVSPAGTLHIVYARNPRPELSGYSDIFHQVSTDGGKSWSAPKNLTDDDPARLVGQYIPNISVAPNGRVDAVWWDTRDDPGIRSNDVYYAYSTDEGKTWSANKRITDQPVDRRVGIWGANYDISSPPAVTSTNAYAMFGWDDTRNTSGVYDPAQVNSEFGGGLQDVYTAAVQFETLSGGTSKTAKLALAGVVGLVAVGIVLLVVALATRRTRRPAPKETVGDRPGARVS
ncbi:MAG: glycoside hydrolase [Actinomycetota bacterium]|nr:glycoside hydrolase [Actinomycetota bacterium]